MCDVVLSRTVSTPRPRRRVSRGLESGLGAEPSFDGFGGEEGSESKAHEVGQDCVSSPPTAADEGQLRIQDGSIQDQLVALEQMRLELEKTIAIFAGARKFLEQQLQQSESLGCCAVCQHPFGTASDFHRCLSNIREKIIHTVQVRQDSGVLEAYQRCRREIESLVGLQTAKVSSPTTGASSDAEPVDLDQSALTQSRMVCNIRTGSLTELRNQKVECLAAQECFACQRSLSGTKSADFLTLMDHRAATMEKYLHVHTA